MNWLSWDADGRLLDSQAADYSASERIRAAMGRGVLSQIADERGRGKADRICVPQIAVTASYEDQIGRALGDVENIVVRRGHSGHEFTALIPRNRTRGASIYVGDTVGKSRTCRGLGIPVIAATGDFDDTASLRTSGWRLRPFSEQWV